MMYTSSPVPNMTGNCSWVPIVPISLTTQEPTIQLTGLLGQFSRGFGATTQAHRRLLKGLYLVLRLHLRVEVFKGVMYIYIKEFPVNWVLETMWVLKTFLLLMSCGATDYVTYIICSELHFDKLKGGKSCMFFNLSVNMPPNWPRTKSTRHYDSCWT